MVGKGERYARQLVVPEIGAEGQKRLERAKVVVVGTGGLGSPTLAYLVAAGVGFVRFVDNDVVDLSNLNRQVLHSTDRIGMRKVASAEIALKALNPDIELEPVDETLTDDNARSIFDGMDYAIDASDNFETKFLVNDTAVQMGIPCTVGGVVRWDGQMISVDPSGGACYRCIFGEAPPEGTVKSASELGIVGVTAAIMGSIAASEAIKYILGFPPSSRLIGRLMMVDLRLNDFTMVSVRENPSCPSCARKTPI